MITMPFVRCVGTVTNIYQPITKKAYDHRMVCVLNGNGAVEIDGKAYPSAKGCIYVIAPGIPYRVLSSPSQKIAVINFDCSYKYSHLSQAILSVDAHMFDENKLLASGTLTFFPGICAKLPASALHLLDEMYNTYLRADTDSDFKNFALSSQFMYIITKAIKHTQEKVIDSRATQIYNYIITNIESKMTLEDIARQFNFSPTYVARLLKKNYNVTFRQLIIDARLKRALWLLENTALTCFEISNMLGFYSGQHFSQTFKNKYGVRPTQLR